jgi:DNA-binding CsgD family transcriptional regulator
MSMLLLLKGCPRLDVDVTTLLQGLSITEAALEAGQPTVPWNDAATVFDRLSTRLSPAQVDELCSWWVTCHPLTRIVGQLVSSTTAWLDVFWKASVPLNAVQRVCEYEMREDAHVLRVELHEGLRPCPFWLELSHHVARVAPLVSGDEPLKVLSVEWTGTSLLSRFEPPVEREVADRQRRASQVPLGRVFDSLALFGEAAGALVRDGHFAFDPSVRGHVDEVATLAKAWMLTLTEARVTLSLAEGRTPQEVSEHLGLALSTVRVHLKHAYAKTETSGQRELVERVKHWRLH